MKKGEVGRKEDKDEEQRQIKSKMEQEKERERAKDTFSVRSAFRKAVRGYGQRLLGC